MKSVLVSAVIITYNAERLLASVLAALAWCDEVLIVDSGSTDQTLAIARQYGARIIYRAFDGYGPQKAFAVSQASRDWVLVVDADEIVTPELRDEIIRRIGREPMVVGYYIPITLIFQHRLMRHGGEFKNPHLRLFNRQFGTYTQQRVHEEVLLSSGKTPTLQHQILHDSYGSLQHYIDKLNHYTTLGAKELYDCGKRTSRAKIIFRFPLTFFREYLLRKHFLNGYPGFLWAFLSATYPVLKYAKLWEAHRQNLLTHRPVPLPADHSDVPPLSAPILPDNIVA